MAEPLDGRELLAIRARAMRARDGLHQSIRVTEDDREALLWEVERVRVLHSRSLYSASRGEKRGQHYCIECTAHADDGVYVLWPCATFGPTRAPDSPSPAPSPVSAATGEHDGANEPEEAGE